MTGRALLAGMVAMLLAAGSASAAEVVSKRAEAVAATLYQSYRGYPDIALIAETRPVDLPAGDSVIRFDDVVSTLLPQSAQVSGLPEPPRESDFDFDLFDTATVLRKSLGQPVELIQTPPKSAEIRRSGTLVSDQGVVAFAGSTGVEALGCGGPPARLRLSPPAGLRSTPSLSVHLRVARAGRYSLHLSYLAEKLSWKAVYVAKIATGGYRLELEGLIVLDNGTATSFDHVPTRFVAGEISRFREEEEPDLAETLFGRDCWGQARTSDPVRDVEFQGKPVIRPAAAPGGMLGGVISGKALFGSSLQREVVVENLGDLKLFRLDEPLRIAAHQQKLFTFMTAPAVTAAPLFVARVMDRNSPAAVGQSTVVDKPMLTAWRVRNSKALGLGKPLPHGTATLYRGGGYLGDARLATDVAENESFELTGTPDAGVTYDWTITADITANSARNRTHIATLKNTTAHPVAIELRLPQREGRSILSGLLGATTKAGSFIWPTSLAAHQTKTLTFVTRDAD
jgi:hypothetical protein